MSSKGAEFNTRSLTSRVAVDVGSALCASTLVAPIITIIDQSIIKRTHNPAPLREHLLTATRDALRRPVRFITSTPYLLITSLYLATYVTANLTDTVSSTLKNGPADKVYAGTTKFAATSATNMAMCLYKDAQFAKLFGANGSASGSSSTQGSAGTQGAANGKPGTFSSSYSAASNSAAVSDLRSTPVSKFRPTASTIRSYSSIAASTIREAASSSTSSSKAAAAPRVPRISLALFAVRDSMTVFASFNVPPVLGPMIGSNSAAQFIAPAMVQFISTPLHLLGLDLYNRPQGCSGAGCNGGITRACRWQCVRRDWLGAAFARIGRIVPAFGVGGVVNAGMRKRLMGGVVDA